MVETHAVFGSRGEGLSLVRSPKPAVNSAFTLHPREEAPSPTITHEADPVPRVRRPAGEHTRWVPLGTQIIHFSYIPTLSGSFRTLQTT